ncbi:hypothetical protein OESDEN_19215 [Oesophagostomum dentatum]|uniref:Uncharacterized protein n=1 Tax=Oesophagostomum dentatum TaxID=61180 RepID=A0A0B1S854_OESDE|nr:hypothetical protein OESDEN_19215 [Oesophagostomum dentatum]
MHLLPIFPTATYLGYEAHYCYGDKVALIDQAASQIRAEKVDVLVPTTISVEDVRKRMEELRRIKQDEQYLVE